MDTWYFEVYTPHRVQKKTLAARSIEVHITHSLNI